ncbi:MAG: deoxyribodipyrimidine photolyase [Bryobacteraceae bacterium]|nr:deoxyribodipyrimidine photolyase [Bryobacteraceae bacterium]
MNRRTAFNHALAYAIEQANELDLTLLVYEGLTCTYPQANDRIHTFMLENVPDFAASLQPLGVGYCFYPRRKRSDPNDVVYQLAAKAALVVTDDYPTFLPAKHNSSVPPKIGVAYHAVDSSCIVPMNRMEKREWAAYTIRPKIHKLLPEYLQSFSLPQLKHKWTASIPDFHVAVDLAGIPALVASCEIDHAVKPSSTFRGGYENAKKRLKYFVEKNLANYADGRNQPASHATSNLSPYLHFGHISSLEVALTVRDYAEAHQLSSKEFLEELIVRRELSFNFVRYADFTSLESLPDWAKKTMQKHAEDPRPVVLTHEQMELGQSYDDLWNATQKELLLRGKMHGYYRMYWGKKLIEWCSTYEEAFDFMIYLHEKYALDGRDPNTYSQVLWCFGLHDRPWIERPIFGQLRYMSYDGMKRKTNIPAYIRDIEHLERTGQDLAAL